MANTRTTDAEVLERRYPILVREFSIRKGSSGKGNFNSLSASSRRDASTSHTEWRAASPVNGEQITGLSATEMGLTLGSISGREVRSIRNWAIALLCILLEVALGDSQMMRMSLTLGIKPPSSSHEPMEAPMLFSPLN
ncbi:hypothetical protein QQZ08_001876 [Neonectria magnoliae]|uniref:Hydantoinase B/oxoprolinase domain-containing protein n=1 Tax=Neonectria magnoliae TaxID=2732573 RepID=A0ABR1IFW5_9HYPO